MARFDPDTAMVPSSVSSNAVSGVFRHHCPSVYLCAGTRVREAKFQSGPLRRLQADSHPSANVFPGHRYQHRALSLSRLLHGGFVWEQPRRALPRVKGERGQNLITIASRIRHSRFYSVLPPPPLEDRTESVMPKHGPMLFEYRYRGGSGRRGTAGTKSGAGATAAAARTKPRDTTVRGNAENDSSTRPHGKAHTQGGASGAGAAANPLALPILPPLARCSWSGVPVCAVDADGADVDVAQVVSPEVLAAAEEMRRHVGSSAKMMEQTVPRHPELCQAFRTASGASGRGHLVVCVHGLAGNK